MPMEPPSLGRPTRLGKNNQPGRSLYKTARWKRERQEHLEQHRRCVECGVDVFTLPPQQRHVDHRTPHRGDPDLFWNRSNWQTMCGRDHGRKIAKYDGGFGNRRK